MTVLSVVIPCLNESERLPPSLRQIAEHLAQSEHWLPAELVVVDDGSLDDTAGAARSAAMPTGVRLAVERHDRNRGKGAAVRTGFLNSSGEYLLLCDADLATPIDCSRTWNTTVFILACALKISPPAPINSSIVGIVL